MRQYQNLLLNIKKYLTFKFEDKEAEKEYQDRVFLFEKKFFFWFNVLIIISTASCISQDLYFNNHQKHIYFEAGLIPIYLLHLLMFSKFPRIHKLSLLTFTLTHQIYLLLEVFYDANTPQYSYIKGSLWGMMEIYMLVSIRTRWLKFALLLYLISTKIILFGGGSTFQVVIFFIIFSILHEYSVRKVFYQLIESRDRLKKFEELVSHHLTSALLVVSDDLQKILFKNSYYEELIFTNDEIKRQIFAEIQKKLDQYQETLVSSPEISIDSQNHTKSGKSLTHVEKQFAFEESIRNFHVSAKKLHWDDKPAIMVIIDDLTMKQTIENLKRVDEYKDKVIASISHELRTPLNGILGMLEASFDLNPENEIRQYLKNCESCAKLLLHFVNSILDLNQIKVEKCRVDRNWFSVKDLTNELIGIYSYMAKKKNVNLVIDIPKETPAKIFTDKLKLCQVLINLTTNALKFTKENGTVKISATFNPDNSKFTFAVHDSGIGIKPEDLDRLFKAFGKLEQEDRKINSAGVGLGLFISNELVKLLNESSKCIISVESTQGAGSKFSFCVPSILSQEDLNDSHEFSRMLEDESLYPSYIEMAENHKFNPKPSSSKFKNYSTVPSNESSLMIQKDKKSDEKTILVVDDNTFNLLAVSRHIAKLNYGCVTCMSGEEAIKLLQEKEFDLVLMDIQMPILDGIETTKIIKEKVKEKLIKDVPIIALTANGEVHSIAYSDVGMVDLMIKPVGFEDFKKTLYKWTK